MAEDALAIGDVAEDLLDAPGVGACLTSESFSDRPVSNLSRSFNCAARNNWMSPSGTSWMYLPKSGACSVVSGRVVVGFGMLFNIIVATLPTMQGKLPRRREDREEIQSKLDRGARRERGDGEVKTWIFSSRLSSRFHCLFTKVESS